MYCRQCGSENEDSATFCTRCGALIGSGTAPSHSVTAGKKVNRNAVIAIFAIIALLSAGIAGFVIWTSPDGEPFTADEHVLYADGDVGSGYISIIADPSDTDPSDGSCTIILTMNAKTLGDYSWGIRCLDQALYAYDGVDTYEYAGHSMPDGAVLGDGGKTLTCTLDPGRYSVNVEVNGRTYSGTFVLQGEVVRNYSWTFDPTYSDDPTSSIEFDLEFIFQYGDCLAAAEYTGERGIGDVRDIEDLIAPFVSENEVITELESRLDELYYEETGSIPVSGSYLYASYILAFVQEEFSYPTADSDGEEWGPDELLYGKSEYWAFPTETIMQGAGDCEDTSFLCAVLFRAAGYDAAVAMVPGHAMAGVELTADPYSHLTPSYVGEYRMYQTLMFDGASTTYYGCETTTDSQYHIGYTSVEYNDNQLTDYMDINRVGIPTGMDGFYPI